MHKSSASGPDSRKPAAGSTPPFFNPGLPFWGSRAEFNRDPLGFYLKGYLLNGGLFRTIQLGQTYHVLAGPEANEFVRRHSDLWDYALARAHFRENFSDRYLPQLNGTPHQGKRRRLSPAFEPATLMRHLPAMSGALERRIDGLGGAPTDLRAFARNVVTSMTSVAFMRSDLPPGVDDAIALFEHDLLRGASLGSLRRLWYARPSYRRNRDHVFAAIGKALAERPRPAEGGPPDLIALMLPDDGSDTPPPGPEEMVHDVAMFYLAGSDATSAIILWAMLFLARDPEWLAELRAELGAWDPARFTGLAEFPKLRATIMEVERLRPPFPTFGRAPSRDFEFGGYTVAKGTPIIHVISLCHFMEDVFSDPFRFRPARFIERPESARQLGLFGSGPHTCLGQPLARIQETLAIAHIAANYDVAFTERPSLEAKFEGVTTPLQASVQARLVRRRA